MSHTLETDNKPSFVLSAESVTLIRIISAGTVGDTFTHADLRAHLHGSDHRHLMPTIRSRLRQESGMVIGSIHGVGYKILSCVEILDKGEDFRSRIRKANKRRVGELKTIQPEALPDEGVKGRYFQEVAHTAMMHAIHEKGHQKRMSDAARTMQPAPGVALSLPQLQQLFAPAVR